MTGVDLGGATDGEFDDKPAWYRSLHETHAYDDGKPDPEARFGPATAKGYDRVADPAKAIQAYIGMCNMLDVYIGRLLDSLRGMGALENTIVVFTSDHGDYLGQHGFWAKGLPAYDDAQKVPMIIWWPSGMGGERRGRTQSLFSLVDLPATFLDAAGLKPTPDMQGISQMPVIRGEVESARDWILTEFIPRPLMHQKTFVKDGHKLVVNEDDSATELYDLGADARQMRNLARLSEHDAVKSRLLADLKRVSKES